MQITIYLPEEMIERVEALARRREKSRSALIQEILAEGLLRGTRGTPPGELLECFGGWKMEPAEVKAIRKARGKDARRAVLR